MGQVIYLWAFASRLNLSLGLDTCTDSYIRLVWLPKKTELTISKGKVRSGLEWVSHCWNNIRFSLVQYDNLIQLWRAWEILLIGLFMVRGSQTPSQDLKFWVNKIDVLLEQGATSRINKPEFSQPMCTAIQIGLVDLLRSWNVLPVVTVGHSSGNSTQGRF